MDVGAVKHPPSCANCGSQLAGRYCSSCGQRADAQAHSVGYFLHELLEALTHGDSHVWATLMPLLRRPGFLTHEYFAGRRARYLQPLRVYLFMSVVFLVLSAVLGEGASVHEHAPGQRAPTTDDCAHVQTNITWGGQPLLPRLQAACRKAVADNGRMFGENMVRNLGRAMFVFLPLMAALMKLMYWRPRRYYLEHLVLLLHNHACVFLLLSIFLVASHPLGSGSWTDLLVLVLIWYVVRYLYRSMKVMYGQPRWLTVLKFGVLACAYLLCGSLMLLATAFFSI